MRKRVGIGLAIALVAVEVVVLRRRSGSIGGNVVVRCRAGHLFTTLWIPGGSVKALRFGWWRFQRCPIGPHWAFVTPVVVADLTDDERRAAALHHDLRIP